LATLARIRCSVFHKRWYDEVFLCAAASHAGFQPCLGPTNIVLNSINITFAFFNMWSDMHMARSHSCSLQQQSLWHLSCEALP